MKTPDASPLPDGTRFSPAPSPAHRPRAADLLRIDARHVLRTFASPPAALRVGDDSFPVLTTACTFGRRQPRGRRAWLRCRCGRRVGVIYAFPDAPAHYACRSCLSVRDADSHPAARRRRRAWAIRRRLGDHTDPETYAAVGFRPVPPKPPRMWRRTYVRLVDELRDLEDAGAAPRSGRPRGMTAPVYARTLRTMARAPDGGRVEAGVMTLRTARLAAKRGRRPLGDLE